MNTKLKLLAIAQIWSAAGLTASGQGTAFTYQGRLNDGTNPANGNYDLRFIVFDTGAGGSQQGPLLTNSATAVNNGLFTVALDFGNQFPGTNRWLEIGVRTNGGGGFFTLSPRQPLMPAPYSIYAEQSGVANSAPWSGLSGVPAGNGLIVGGGNTLGVNFGGSGAANTVARSDHDHYGQSWTGAAASGLALRTTSVAANTAALKGQQGATFGVSLPPAGVLGTSSDGYGVIGVSSNGTFGGLFGWGAATNGDSYGVYGESDSPSGGVGVYAVNGSQTGATIGVRGITYSVDGIGGSFANANLSGPGTGAAVRGVLSGASRGDIHPGGFLLPAAGEFAGANGVIGASRTNSNGYGVIGITPDSGGVAIFGWASGAAGGSGVVGQSDSLNGVGISAYNGTGRTGVALQLLQGSIKVPGAGVGASTPVFIHRATGANIETGNTHRTTITHPLCDGDPNAILIITPNYNPGGVGGTGDSHALGVFFNSTLNKWQIFHQDFQPMNTNAAYNILVVKP